MKTDHPIRINHARQQDSAGGRWQRLDPLGQGRVQILAVPADRIGQAVVVMAELMRLKALDPDADWSDFAVLAHNRATLDPIRAWCQQNKVAYRLSDRESAGPKFHQTREACCLLDLLRSKPARRLRPGCLARWFHARFGGEGQENPWLTLLGQFIGEIDCVWGDMAVPTGTVIEEFYEFGADAARSERGRLTISTVHSAKGREFRHVAILDGGDWNDPGDAERRVYYVGMTRAKENLILSQATRSPNPFSPPLDGPAITRSPLPSIIHRPEALGWRYITLGLGDVDLSFAGRQAPHHTIHRVLEALAHGDPLEAIVTDRGLEFRVPDSGIPIGRTAKRFEMPLGKIMEVRVDALVRRQRSWSDPGFANLIQVDRWWIVLPTITLNPMSAR